MKKQNASVKPITEIRSRGLSQVNRLVTARRELPLFKSAFADWRAGDIYICKKTGDYRHRYGSQCRSTASWSSAVRAAFPTVALFALAALVFDDGKENLKADRAPLKKNPEPKTTHQKTGTTGRTNIIQLAKEVAA